MQKVFIKNLTTITEEKQSIGYIHYKPLDNKYGLGETEEQLNKVGKVLNLPDNTLVQIEGKGIELFYNPVTNALFWDYVDINDTPSPDSPEAQIRALQEQITIQEEAIADMATLIGTLMGNQTLIPETPEGGEE